MKTYDPRQPAVFLHMPKCAGSSFIRLLRRWFGDQYHKLNQDETQDLLLPRIATCDDDGNWLPEVKCIHGHFDNGRGYGLPYFYPEITQYFTVLRDPFDIAVSMFFFCKKRSAEGKFWYRGRQENILDKYPTVEYYLKEAPYWIYNHLPQDITLQNYEQRLSERFFYIGIQEDLDLSIRRLAKILGKPYVELERFNESEYDEPIPHWLREEFYEDYPLLKHVYDFSVARYASEDYVWFNEQQHNVVETDRARSPQPSGHFYKAGSGEVTGPPISDSNSASEKVS
ncbi:MAG: sulfotransferase family 2 domain-containing protein [Planctomycetaceae bacterium]|nr:sulfotransferase family 2 domain-containing protein [Planctomycetaceae bacterium]